MTYFYIKSIMGLAILLFSIGIILGNIAFLSIAFVHIIFLAIAFMITQPQEISFERRKNQTRVFVGQIIERNALISVKKGIGLVIIYDSIPKEFRMIEGSNYVLLWKGLRPLNFEIKYKITCDKRGEYHLLSPLYESRHPLNVREVFRDGGHVEGVLTVMPKLLNVRRIRNQRTLSKIPMPPMSAAKTGLPTTDFQELREYSYGDPYTSINWKATARFNSRGAKLPYVNVFEKEGKKVVWLLLDVSVYMAVGTSVRNALDCAADAANALSRFYLERGCSVGLYICTKDGVVKPPDTGKRQYQSILKELIKAKVDPASQPLTVAVEHCGKYFMGVKPLFIIITRLTRESAPYVLRAVKEARKYTRPTKGKHSIIVIDVDPHGLVSREPVEDLASQALQIFTKPEALAIRRLGGLYVRWKTTELDFSELMLRGMRAW